MLTTGFVKAHSSCHTSLCKRAPSNLLKSVRSVSIHTAILRHVYRRRLIMGSVIQSDV